MSDTRPKRELLDNAASVHPKSTIITPVSVKAKKKRKRKTELACDPNYKNKKRRKKGFFADGLFHLRCDTRTHMESGDADQDNQQQDKDQPKTQVRITGFVDLSKMEIHANPVSLEKFNDAFLQHVRETNSPYWGPLIKVLEKNANHSPVKALVGSPTKGSKNTYTVARDLKIGFFSVMSNRNLLLDDKVIKSFPQNDNFYHSVHYQKIKKYFDAFKEKKVCITPGFLRKMKNNSTCNRNQQSKMGGSAGKYAEATELFVSGLKWDWVHLIAYCVLGDDSQSEDNLVAGTFHANTNMAFVERELKYLASHFPEGFTLKARAHMVEMEKSEKPEKEYTQIGFHLEYEIYAQGTRIPFDFNLQAVNQPHISYKDLIRVLFKTIVGMKITNDKLSGTDQNREKVQSEKAESEKSAMHCYFSKGSG